MIAMTLALARQRSPAFFLKNTVCSTSIVTKSKKINKRGEKDVK